jgi:hypothetical protein
MASRLPFDRGQPSGVGISMSVERIILVGLLGWLVVGIVLMGLDIW